MYWLRLYSSFSFSFYSCISCVLSICLFNEDDDDDDDDDEVRDKYVGIFFGCSVSTDLGEARRGYVRVH